MTEAESRSAAAARPPQLASAAAAAVPFAEIADPFRRLVRIMERLQEPGGCPWDLQQTHESLKPYMVEEAYEALEAIDRGDMDELAGELGDVLLQVLFHSALAKRSHQQFTIDDICRRAGEKMVRRHPHVFGEAVAEEADTVLRNWEALKAQERAQSAQAGGKGGSGALSGVPGSLPALVRAHRMQEKAARQGVDWPSRGAALEECRRNFEAWAGAMSEAQAPGACGGQREKVLADLLWSLTGVARLSEQNAEEALRGACDRFRQEFERAETAAAETGKPLAEAFPA